eukprot:4212119-Pyramimonas_sp.AAC.1
MLRQLLRIRKSGSKARGAAPAGPVNEALKGQHMHETPKTVMMPKVVQKTLTCREGTATRSLLGREPSVAWDVWPGKPSGWNMDRKTRVPNLSGIDTHELLRCIPIEQ